MCICNLLGAAFWNFYLDASGETCIHFAVRHLQLEALEFLVNQPGANQAGSCHGRLLWLSAHFHLAPIRFVSFELVSRALCRCMTMIVLFIWFMLDKVDNTFLQHVDNTPFRYTSHFFLARSRPFLPGFKELPQRAVEVGGWSLWGSHTAGQLFVTLFAACGREALCKIRGKMKKYEKVTKCNTGQFWSHIWHCTSMPTCIHTRAITIALYLADCQHASLIPFCLGPWCCQECCIHVVCSAGSCEDGIISDNLDFLALVRENQRLNLAMRFIDICCRFWFCVRSSFIASLFVLFLNMFLSCWCRLQVDSGRGMTPDNSFYSLSQNEEQGTCGKVERGDETALQELAPKQPL